MFRRKTRRHHTLYQSEGRTRCDATPVAIGPAVRAAPSRVRRPQTGRTRRRRRGAGSRSRPRSQAATGSRRCSATAAVRWSRTTGSGNGEQARSDRRHRELCVGLQHGLYGLEIQDRPPARPIRVDFRCDRADACRPMPDRRARYSRVSPSESYERIRPAYKGSSSGTIEDADQRERSRWRTESRSAGSNTKNAVPARPSSVV